MDVKKYKQKPVNDDTRFKMVWISRGREGGKIKGSSKVVAMHYSLPQADRLLYMFLFTVICALYLHYIRFSYVFNDKNYSAKRRSSNMHGYPSPKHKGDTSSASKKHALGKKETSNIQDDHSKAFMTNLKQTSTPQSANSLP